MMYKSKVVTAKGVRIIGSAMHFTLQTAADLVLAGEVEILKRLDVYDMSEEELREARIERTKLKQYKLKQFSKNIFKPKEESQETSTQVISLI